MVLMVMGSTPTVDPLKKSPLITDLNDFLNSSFFQVYRNGLDTNIVQKTIHVEVQSAIDTGTNSPATRTQKMGSVVRMNMKHNARTKNPKRLSFLGNE